MKKIRMIVSGRVQGVGFRYTTLALAKEIGGISGRVWNNDDGTVEILAQSTDSFKMNQFIQRVRQCPSPAGHVSYVDVQMGLFKDFDDFRIAN